ncbi:toprim domain-containing protein [Klebsiella pneumoniae]|uniref:toprim domain-containing protein n=1 Tax=Klebsiella pneumoniae TaxID=573 RepID=UPI000D591048|nr:toprim domain-containing protein [Klebsiella pneumoniae]HBR1160739.1 toprim domain-containing protein [Klebsiella quasipneumoniae subsp. similipneumoniae]HDT1534518.1 toprim domain-containing protein [Klebsiella pneumoniae subsp. pneumoniae]MDL4707851.1 toprim domain-containing protein [Klebsiella pneumoniae]HBR5571848.1 toprim domain-containing protein [Klebsiella pneumoniae]HBR6096544.1 toprim domain-containing protein [Klebsiella pneumoniae]
MRNDFVNDVRSRANGYWPSILERLAIPTNRGEGPCPACGGKTRYRFDNKDNRGTYFCSHCGAGTGLDLVMKVNQCGAREAAELVAEAMALPMPEPKPAREKPQTDIAGKVAALAAKASPGQSAYLASKGLQCPFPMLADGSLLLVLKNGAGATTGAQVIKPDGSKRLVAGTVKKGSFCVVNSGETPETVIIAEGLATALSVQQFRPDATIIAAIDVGNLLPVAQVMRQRYPGAQIIIAADNDIKPGEPNTGKSAAEKSAKAVSGWVALPQSEEKADWNDFHQQHGPEAAAAAFNDSMYQPEGEKVVVKLKAIDGGKENQHEAVTPALNQMGASQRGEVLLAHYDGDLAIHADSDTVHHYNGVVWVPLTDKELQREMAQIYIDAEVAYSQNAIKSAVDTMKLGLPVMGTTARNLIGFSNGVFDTRSGQFRPHNRKDWLLVASDLPFSEPAEGETLATHAPNFWKWLRRSVADNDRKTDRVLAALFMVLANRYDWQLFLEVTGPGGSGKSVMAEICTMLAGKANTVSASMAALENPRERALVVGYSLIIMPDMTRYAGDGAGIKAITGGDKVAIDPKHKAPYSTRIPAVVLAVNNNAMTFSDRSGGISRRRVIFNFTEVVPENDRDPMLAEKIEGELAVIIRHLLVRFSSQNEAKQLLHEQQKSEEALAIKREGDSLVDFCGYLMASVVCDGMLIGNAEIVPFSPRRYLYHAYLAYMRANGLSKPVSLMRFGTDMPGAMAEYGKKYEKRKTKHGIRSNVTLHDDSEDWMPSCNSNSENGEVE